MQHQPRIAKGSADEWHYDDGDVRAVISSDLRSHCQILEFASINSGKGNGRAAVEWMKREYQNIHINDPGNEIDTPGAFQFWRKLADSGLIESMVDSDSTLIFDQKEWLVDNLDPDDYPELHRQLTGNAPRTK
jgi:hypothetical protein